MDHGDDDLHGSGDHAIFLPSPEEIELACDQIRKGWSAETERTRKLFRIPTPAAEGVEQRAVAAVNARLATHRALLR